MSVLNRQVEEIKIKFRLRIEIYLRLVGPSSFFKIWIRCCPILHNVPMHFGDLCLKKATGPFLSIVCEMTNIVFVFLLLEFFLKYQSVVERFLHRPLTKIAPCFVKYSSQLD